MNDWKAGDKAVCARGFHLDNGHPNGRPVEGTIYLVAGIFELDGHIGLQIAGLPNLGYVTGRDLGWWHSHFRKIVPRSERKEAIRKKLRRGLSPMVTQLLDEATREMSKRCLDDD